MWNCSRSKPPSILTGINESIDHLGTDKASVKLIQLRQPEIVAGKVCVRRVVGISAQITEVFRQYEGAIGFLSNQSRVFSDSSKCARVARLSIAGSSAASAACGTGWVSAVAAT